MSDLNAFFASPSGKIVSGVGATVIVLGAIAAIGFFEAQHPRVHVANVFSTPLEIRAGAKVVILPAHGSAHLEMEKKDEAVAILLGSREIDRFTGPRQQDDVLNVLGAAPIVREEVEWRAAKDNPRMLEPYPRPHNGNYCGQRIVPGGTAVDILAEAPDPIPIPQGATSVTRARLGFEKEDSPFQCAAQLEEAGRKDDAEKIRKLATETGDSPPPTATATSNATASPGAPPAATATPKGRSIGGTLAPSPGKDLPPTPGR